MSYIDEIFERLDIRQIREFLLNGVECVEVNMKTYEQRIDDAEKPAFDMIEKKFADEAERDEATNRIYRYATETQDVYMEIGMRCGAVLAMQLLRQ